MSTPSWPERAVLALLLAASITLFVWRIRKVIGVMHRARPTPDYSVQPLGRRVLQFFTEVMLQSKVIAQRPLPGLAHALVESTKNRGAGWVSCRLKGCQNLYPAQSQLLTTTPRAMQKPASHSDFNWWW
jgi:hypothetical protein